MSRLFSSVVCVALAITLPVWSCLAAEPVPLSPIVVLEGHMDYVVCAAFSPDSRYVVTGSEDHTAKVWDLQSGQEIRSLEHPSPVPCVAYSPDGSLIATSAYDPESDLQVFIWNTQTGQLIARLPHLAFRVGFSPDGKQLATAGRCGTLRTLPFDVRFWDMTSMSMTLLGNVSLQVPKWYTYQLAYSPDGSRLLVGGIYVWEEGPAWSEFRVARLLETTTKEWLVRFDQDIGVKRRLDPWDTYGPPLAYSPEGSYFALTHTDNTRIVIFDASTFLPIREIPWSVQPYDGQLLAFSPDGRNLAVNRALYNLETQKWLRTFGGYSSSNSNPPVVYSPDGTKVLFETAIYDVSDLLQTDVADWSTH